jgi:hypothetical protein
MKSDEQVLAELAGAAEGLLYMSESDYPLEPFRLEGAGLPTPEILRESAGEAADAPVRVLSLEEFFRAPTSEPSWKGEAELPTARRFQALVRALRENLSDLKAYKVGSINMRVYVLGRSAAGTWLGLSTRVVET